MGVCRGFFAGIRETHRRHRPQIQKRPQGEDSQDASPADKEEEAKEGKILGFVNKQNV